MKNAKSAALAKKILDRVRLLKTPFNFILMYVEYNFFGLLGNFLVFLLDVCMTSGTVCDVSTRIPIGV